METKPVYYRGKAYSCPKHNQGISPHAANPDEVLERIHPCLKKMGLTRISNITNLDRIGIPVASAIRPFFEGMSVSLGKGLTLQSAKVSAAMESLERYHACLCDLPCFEMSYAKLRDHCNVIPLDKLALSKNSIFNIHLPERWTLGWDIVSQTEVAVPHGLVSLSRNPSDLDSFYRSSNGLAAGLDFTEAVSQALFEVIERDAVTCHRMAAQSAGYDFPLKRVRLDTIEYQPVAELLQLIEKVGITSFLFDCTTDTDVPTYECRLIDRVSPYMSLCYGMGTNLDPATAMARAVTEAVQARAVYLSGYRETFFQAVMYANNMYSSPDALEAYERQGAWETTEDCHQDMKIPSDFEGDINICTDKLKKVGTDQVILFDITLPGYDISVVRVVVPGLEGSDEVVYYTPGARALACLKGKKI